MATAKHDGERRVRSVGIIALLAAVLCSTLRADRRKEGVASLPQQGPTTAQVPSYPDTPQGLEKLMKEMIKLEKAGKRDTLDVYSKSLVLPDPDNWFKSVFGDKLGAPLAVLSGHAQAQIPTIVPDLMAQVVRERLLTVEAVRFGDECSLLATDAEFRFLIHRVHSEPLYDVRFHDSHRQLIWSYFAYVDGGFRFIGNMAISMPHSSNLPGADSLPHDDIPHRIRVGGNVEQASLLPGCQVIPQYPSEAKSDHVEGTVILHAIIDKDGEVREVLAVAGPHLLIQPAIDAVKRWRYRQTFLNGEPVEVDTIVTVNFKLGG
jgi:Gram-negative bacterial TonB protein C-terminal